MYEFSFLDVLLAPIYIVILLSLARRIYAKNISTNPAYEFFMKGFYIKIIGAIGLCLVYLFYYGGGDTINYMTDSQVLLRLGAKDPGKMLDILLNGMSKEKYSWFNNDIGYPAYNYGKAEEWRVIRFTTPISILGLNTYFATSILLAWFSYLGNFRLYLVFAESFPKIYKKLAIPLLFIPSAAFWGSGILKDTFTFSAVGWFTYGFYMAFIKRENIRNNLIALFLSAWLILSIKPYIFIALMPGALIWLNFARLQSIKSTFLRTLVMPVLLLALGGGAAYL